ncbi:PEP-CTERM sorting domain-containing protein [Oceaniferula spumae]
MKSNIKLLAAATTFLAFSQASQSATVAFTFSGNKTPQMASGAGNSEILYSFTATGDFDGAADGVDTFTWDIRFSAFNRTIANDQVTLTNQVQAQTDGTEFNSGGNSTNWNSQSLVFAIENEQLTTTAPGSYDYTFNGFTSMFLTAGTFYLGTGADTISLVSTGNSVDTFAAPQLSPLVITATNSERNRQLSGSFTIAAVPEPSSTALLGLGGIALILRHRRA